MEIPDLSDDSMDDPLYNPNNDVSEDEDIEAAIEAALMEIPDLSDDSMNVPLYNPDNDVSEDEDVEASLEAALNAEVGELKEDTPKDPLKDDKRIDFANVGLSPEEYIKSRTPQETKKSTKQAVKLYDTVMGKKATMDGAIFKPILETPVDELPNMLSSFFLVAKKVNGNVYNASSLSTYFQSLARFIVREYKPPIDIKTDPRFKIVRDTLDSRCTEVAELGERPGKHAARSVSEDTMKLAFEKGTLGRSNPRALVTLIQHLMMTGFGCRAKKVNFK